MAARYNNSPTIRIQRRGETARASSLGLHGTLRHHRHVESNGLRNIHLLNINGTGWFISRFWSTRPLTGRRVTGSRLGLSNARKRLKGRPLTDSHSSQPRHIQGVGRFALPLPSSTVLLVIREGDRSMQVQGFWGSSRRNTDAFVHRTASQSRGAIRWRAALAGLGFFFHLMRRRAAECV